MTLHYQDDRATIYHGDCRDIMEGQLPDNWVDSIVTDPPYELGFMSKGWDASGIAYNVEVWENAYRILKPGGHLLAFGGTRTWHRLAVAIEDAGFEVRDSIAWMYGSGFPKSHDVSKAIDKAAGHWRGKAGDVVSENDALGGPNYERTPKGDPITAAAAAWAGWGTALKPAFEPIVVARKPLSTAGINVLKMVESELKERGVEGEITWTSAHASDAGKLVEQKNLSSIAVPQVEETSVAHAGANETLRSDWPTANYSARSTQSGERIIPNSSKQPAVEVTDDSESKFLTTTAESAPAAENQSLNFLPLTTLTEAGQHTASQFTEKFTPNFDAKDSLPVIASFAGIATGLTGSRALVRIDQLSDGSFIWPKSLPRSFSTPLTVAENVLAHGTGALNIDGCRIGMSDADAAAIDAKHAGMDVEAYERAAGHSLNLSTSPMPLQAAQAHALGRWPANVILDESQAAALDAQSGDSPAKPEKVAQRGGSNPYPTYWDESNGDLKGIWPADPGGGASRFFYCPKASTAERPREDGIAHPTVKPLKLMEYLCRLVTPPGGTVLEPFAGSGTTIEAALNEGFNVIGIEMTDEYLPLIIERIERYGEKLW